MIAWMLGLLGCGADCGAGCPLGTSCDDGECVIRACATSTQCPLGRHCDDAGECVPGCEHDGDCLVGERCDADAECVPARCEVAATDCRWREECVAGECVDAGEPHCSACTGDGQCGGGDNICFAGEWCGAACGPGGACPAGFACMSVDHTDGATHDVCLSACWLESR